jgi:hypothetical protein
MDSGGKHRMRKATVTVYRIVVRDELSEGLASAFEGMEMVTRGGQTILTGEVVDHSHLHSILDRIGALGLKLVNVEALPQDAEVSSNPALPNYSDNEVQQ